jgi:phage terminase small subunit
MPRKSVEDLAAAYYRTKGKAAAPPPHLDDGAKAIWRQITRSRPPDFFTAGSLPLLEAYCVALAMHRWYANLWRTDFTNRDNFVRHIASLNSSLSMLAVKLRLTNSSIDKRSGKLTERGDPVPEDGERDNVHGLLFGRGRF